MSHLWIRNDAQDAPGSWAASPLSPPGLDLGIDPPRPLDWEDAVSSRAAPVLLVPSGAGDVERWVVLADASKRVHVNGLPLLGGIRVLVDQDEIRVDGVLYYYSREILARVEPFPGSGTTLFCPRCTEALTPPDSEQSGLSVRCPRCRVWFHEREELPCWTYAPVCALCSQPTELDTTFQWTPEA